MTPPGPTAAAGPVECPAKATNLEHGAVACPNCDAPGIAEGHQWRCPNVDGCQVSGFRADGQSVSPDDPPAQAHCPACDTPGRLFQHFDDEWALACHSERCRVSFYFENAPAGWSGTDGMLAEARDNHAAQIRNADGELVDGAGRRLYSVSEDVARLHHRVYDLGWRHDPAASGYRNLRALVEIAPDTDRQTVEAFAFRFILGYGPGGVSLQRALDRLGVSHGGGSL